MEVELEMDDIPDLMRATLPGSCTLHEACYIMIYLIAAIDAPTYGDGTSSLITC